MTEQTSNELQFSDQTRKRVMAGWAVVMAGVVGFMIYAGIDRPSHDTLMAAGLTGRSWSDTEVPTARRITSRQLDSMADNLADASETGDMAAVWQMSDDIAQVLGAWNDQADGTRQAGHYCMLAALHLSDGMTAVSAGAEWDRKRFDASLKRC